MPSFRRYALTFFTAPDFKWNDEIRYFLAGEEVCPETKRTHYQAYIELTKKTSLKKLKKLVDDNKVHVEPCKGDAQSNIDYCKKDGKIYREEGTPAKPGNRSDLINMREHFKARKRNIEAIEDNDLVETYAKYPRFVATLRLVYTTQRTEMTELHFLIGPTGTGKSHTAYEEAKALGEVYFKPSGEWFDGYDQEPCIVFEDFRGETSLAMMLRLADKYPLKVPYKGGFINFNSKRIYITTNNDIDELWNKQQQGYDRSIAALKRRITSIRYLNEVYSKEQD